jgi:pSer/pThr/pTyr-binding forkhead associated (FHA) protein
MWILQGAGDTSSSKDDGATDALVFRVSPGGTKTIGRATGADFILDAALVSRLHCRLEAGIDAMAVIDLESTNGTYVNGRRIERAQLLPGDRLRIGRVELTVRRADAPPAS